MKIIQSDQERKAGFQTSQARFSQYDQWARKTSMFLGPGVYEDVEKFKSLTRQPCAALYVRIIINTALQRKSTFTKDAGGKEGYTMIGGNMIMYEPAFDKSRKKQLFDNMTGYN